MAAVGLPEGSAEIVKDTKLGKGHRAGGVAVEALHLPVDKLEDVAARSIHPLASWGDHPAGHLEWALVSALQRELDNHNVAHRVEPVQLPMHVRECLGVVDNGVPNVS